MTIKGSVVPAMSEADRIAEAQMSDMIGRAHLSGGTHADLFAAVQRQFGPITLDLAASAEDTLVPAFISPQADTFKQSWADEIGDGCGWLNPPSGDLAPWGTKMLIEAQRGAKFCALLPLSLDTDWCWALAQTAGVFILTPRMLYDGVPIPLAVFAFNSRWGKGLARWHWRTGRIDV